VSDLNPSAVLDDDEPESESDFCFAGDDSPISNEPDNGPAEVNAENGSVPNLGSQPTGRGDNGPKFGLSPE
jgi:hypothetical protein